MDFLKEIDTSQIVIGAIAIYIKIRQNLYFIFLVSLTAAANRHRVAICPPFAAFRRFSLPRRDEIERGKRLLRL